MAFEAQVLIDAGPAHAAVTWTIQLLNDDGTNNGASFNAQHPPGSILTNLGGGYYNWHYYFFPDDGTLINFTASDGYTFIDRIEAPVVGGGSGSGLGDGDTEVDHNTGPTGLTQTDYLRFVDSHGAGIDNALVLAYLKADYDSGIYTRRGRTVTKSDGRWVDALLLNSGLTYKIRLEKPGVFGPDVREVTVA